MPYSHILERPPLLIDKHVVELVQHVESLDNVTKHGVLAVQILDLVGKRHEELAAAATDDLARPVRARQRRRDRHRHGTTRGMLERVEDFGAKIASGCVYASLC